MKRSFAPVGAALRVVAVLSALGFATACGPDPELKKREHVAAGDRYVAAKNDEAAIIEYRSAVQLDPNFGEPRYSLALAYIRQGDIANSLPQLIRAADLLSERDDVQVAAARLLLMVGRFDDAKGRIAPVITRSPQNVVARVILGNALAGLREPDQALAQIEEATKLAPENATPFANLGAIYASRGNRDAAERAFLDAVARDSVSPYPRLALAQFYWQDKQLDKAEAVIAKALADAPADALVTRFAATFYQATGRNALAEQALRAAAEADQTPGSRLELGRYYATQGATAEAERQLTPLDNDPAVGSAALLLRARLALTTGDIDKAAALVDRVIAKDGARAEALLIRSAILFGRGQSKEALEILDAIARQQPDSVEAMFLKGRILRANGELEQAREAFGRVLQINPGATAAQRELSQILLALGHADAAVSTADAAIKDDTDGANTDAHLGLARALIAKNQLDAAERVLKTASERRPSDASLIAVQGSLDAMRGNHAAAERSWRKALELDADQIEAILGLGRLEIVRGDKSAAVARAQAGATRRPEPSMFAAAARVLYLADDLSGSEAMAKQALERDPGILAAYSLLGQIYLKQGNIAQAEAEFTRLAARQTKPVAALTMVGMLQETAGRVGEARSTFERVLQIDSGAGVAANNLAWLYAEQNIELDRALSLALTAKSALSGEPSVVDTLGWVYVKMSRHPEAIAALSQAVDRDPANPLFHYHLGVAFLNNGDRTPAKKHLQRAAAAGGFAQAADASRLLASI